ncbi:MAG: bifunctional glutamate N-acetyltransferase/amino-acid acetyltransferase ArgJ [Candidatus Korobacteraceae bacterium]
MSNISLPDVAPGPSADERAVAGPSVPRGFLFSATIAGIKASGRPDLALAEAPHGAAAAAMFTRNRLAAAPLQVDRAHLKRSRGRVRAVLVNAGNANCATGQAGIKAAQDVCRELGKLLQAAPEFIFPSSTGIIGVPLPAEKLVRALPAALASRSDSPEALLSFARAIMTTDTARKIAEASFHVRDKEVRLVGAAKGSGMIHPKMATMLVYLFTDIEASAAQLQAALRPAVDASFNCISVDGDTSTNDTVLLLASGKSGVKLGQPGTKKQFQLALAQVCGSLAEQIARDGEGAKHLVRLRIEQAKSVDEARTIARAIANSPLVKTAWAGCDPNWGRILSSIGNSGVACDMDRISVFIGPHQVCRAGQAVAFDKVAAHEHMQQREYEIVVRLGRGKAALNYLSCDLTVDYVHINADYST